MAPAAPQTLNCFAPAKINLYLHITDRLDNGYHTLDTLIAFADIGDLLKIENAKSFCYQVDGPFSKGLANNSKNLVSHAAHAIAKASGNELNVRITLTKNLPVAAGIGGGSADAAATIRGLMKWWNIAQDEPYLPELTLSLGADTPICFSSKPARVHGIGEKTDRAPTFPELSVILINPMRACHTPAIFNAYDENKKNHKPLLDIPEHLSNPDHFISFLDKQNNDLQDIAAKKIPEIIHIIETLKNHPDCALARMSGSGATCFGLFKNKTQAQKAFKEIKHDHPQWWVQTGTLRNSNTLFP